MAHFLEHKLLRTRKETSLTVLPHWAPPAMLSPVLPILPICFRQRKILPGASRFCWILSRHRILPMKAWRRKGELLSRKSACTKTDPGWRIYFNLLGALYQKHPVKKDIAGSVESIRQITKDVLYQCYRTFYHPSNMILFVVGDVDAQGIFKQVENNLKKYNYRPLGEIKNIFPPEPEAIAESYVEQRLAVSSPCWTLVLRNWMWAMTANPLAGNCYVFDAGNCFRHSSGD